LGTWTKCCPARWTRKEKITGSPLAISPPFIAKQMASFDIPVLPVRNGKDWQRIYEFYENPSGAWQELCQLCVIGLLNIHGPSLFETRNRCGASLPASRRGVHRLPPQPFLKAISLVSASSSYNTLAAQFQLQTWHVRPSDGHPLVPPCLKTAKIIQLLLFFH
jgi:hypothetical protein